MKAISEKGRDYIKTKVDYSLVEQYMKLCDAENGLGKAVAAEVYAHPMWSAFFEGVKGCGPLMAGICLAYLDPYKARHASSFWRYCGLDVVYDEKSGTMRGNGRWHTEVREYQAKDGTKQEKTPSPITRLLRPRLLRCWLAPSSRPVITTTLASIGTFATVGLLLGDSPAVQHRRASRYCAKMFLRDMWVVWRELEGLPVSEPYEVAKLGHKPHGT